MGVRTGCLRRGPAARGLLLSDFTRGAVTGLGLVNLLLAVRDAVRAARRGRKRRVRGGLAVCSDDRVAAAVDALYAEPWPPARVPARARVLAR